jgi:hypothetical protein
MQATKGDLVVSLFTCLAPLIIVAVGVEPWGTKLDIQTLNRANIVCADKYEGCVKSIEKKTNLDYVQET